MQAPNEEKKRGPGRPPKRCEGSKEGPLLKFFTSDSRGSQAMLDATQEKRYTLRNRRVELDGLEKGESNGEQEAEVVEKRSEASDMAMVIEEILAVKNDIGKIIEVILKREERTKLIRENEELRKKVQWLEEKQKEDVRHSEKGSQRNNIQEGEERQNGKHGKNEENSQKNDKVGKKGQTTKTRQDREGAVQEMDAPVGILVEHWRYEMEERKRRRKNVIIRYLGNEEATSKEELLKKATANGE
ncbi:WD repeat-containing protein 87-like [Agrilus planipennis]|uniref:WD repeat-containing protein 87-like n=1 Tax=Agrilus planipennis TaxID=224129 RepID=A0A1W4XM31_AGRPL|nr:WD repeat-containing protein 87-like [Agrilus planipennis]